MILRAIRTIGLLPYMITIAVLTIVMALSLAPTSFDSWQGWWLAIGGSAQAIGPASLGFSFLATRRMWTGPHGEVRKASPRSTAEQAFWLALSISVATWLAYLVGALGVILFALDRDPWNFHLSIWFAVPGLQVASYVALGILLGVHIRVVWAVVPLIFGTYALQLFPLYLDTPWARISPIQQAYADAWSAQAAGTAWFAIVWFAVPTVAACLALRQRAKLIMSGGSAGFAVLAVAAMYQLGTQQGTTYFERTAAIASPVCDGAEPVVCLHPAYANSTTSANAQRVAALVRMRMEQVGVPIERFQQVHAASARPGVSDVLNFEIYSPYEEDIRVGFQDGLRARLFDSCGSDVFRTDFGFISFFEDWATSDTWPHPVSGEYASEERDIVDLADAGNAEQSVWIKSRLRELDCEIA